LAVAGGVGSVVYVVTSYVLGSEELRTLALRLPGLRRVAGV
jgi:hypothetical protein